MKKIIILILLISICFSQNIRNIFSNDSENNNENSLQMNQNVNLTNLENLTYTPVGKPIDPDTYILGPGDLLGINIISAINTSLPLRVNPVGEILIPSIGVINVNGISLSSAKRLISDYIKETTNKNAIIDVTLMDIRRFKILLLGAVNNPGYVYVSALDKVHDVIKQNDGLQKFAHPDIVQINRGDDTLNININEYLSGKDILQNIMLSPGDIIFVPYNDYANSKGLSIGELNNSQIIVYGFVNKTSSGNIFRYFPGYTVRDYIALAGGTKEQNSSFRAGNANKTKLYRSDGTIIKKSIDEIVHPGDMIEVPPSILYQIVGGDGVIRTLTALASIASSVYIIDSIIEKSRE